MLINDVEKNIYVDIKYISCMQIKYYQGYHVLEINVVGINTTLLFKYESETDLKKIYNKILLKKEQDK